MMNFRFTIARKLAVGFGVLLIAVLSTSIATYRTLQENLDYNQDINDVYNPSATSLNNLYALIAESKMLIKNWAYIDKQSDTSDKKKLIKTHSQLFPELHKALQPLVENWSMEERNVYLNITLSVDTLFDYHKNIMSMLNSFSSYSNPNVVFGALGDVDNNGKITVLTDRILTELDELRTEQEKNVETANKKMKKSFASFQKKIVWFGIALAISVIAIAIWATNTLVSPINSIKNTIEGMGKGVLPEQILTKRADEIGDMFAALYSLVSGLRETSRFALEIGDENFATTYDPLGKQDVLGNALLVMRDNLKRAAMEDENRKSENMERSWAAQGLAKFGEMLRENNDNIEELASVIISGLVKYLDANQGGLFMVNDEDVNNKYIELISFYAYSRKKFLEKKILIGENLIGQCVLEGETIYMTDLPDGYIEITSGLGEETPRSLMIVPLKLNEEIYGVVEIASFNEFKKHQIEFVEKIGETIASTIQRVKINIQTNLLLEESRKKSEMLAQQEEDARNKIIVEEVKDDKTVDTQETVDRMNKYEQKMLDMYEELEHLKVQLVGATTILSHTESALNNNTGKLTLDLKGVVLNVNDYLLATVAFTEEMFVGKFLSDYLSDETIAAIEFQEMWPALHQGHIQSRVDRYSFEGARFWFNVTFTPLKNDVDEYETVIALFENITEHVEKEESLRKQIEQLEISIKKSKS